MIESYLNFRLVQLYSWVLGISTTLQMCLSIICELSTFVVQINSKYLSVDRKILKQSHLEAEDFQILP
jgi:hypothetical protein